MARQAGRLPTPVRADDPHGRGGPFYFFAVALETLAVKTFGDVGQTARLRIICDQFIAGHDSCALLR